MSKYHRSQTARDMGGDEHSILVNINSTLFNLNSLIKLAQNRFNAEFIVEQGGIEAIAQIMVYHSANPTIMKAVRGIFNNIVEFNPTNSGILDRCINASISSPKGGLFETDIFNCVLTLGVQNDGIMGHINKALKSLKAIETDGEKSNEMTKCDASIQNIFSKMRGIIDDNDNEMNEFLTCSEDEYFTSSMLVHLKIPSKHKIPMML